MSSDDHTYFGPWVNWSHGNTLGATITFSNHTADILLALFALFVAFATSKLWAIVIFGVCGAPVEGTSDVLGLLTILGRSAPPETTAWKILRMTSAPRSKRKIWPWVFLPMVGYAIIGAAGIFSPNAIKHFSSETLIRSSGCGFWNYRVTDNSPATTNQWMLNTTTAALQYARNCYGAPPNSSQCRRFSQQDIKWSSTSNVECPFSPSICRINATSAHRMDTGLLDSHVDLGINASPKDRVNFRKVTTCATLNGTRFGKIENETDSSGRVDKYLRLYFGTLEDISEYTYSINMEAVGVGYGYSLTPFIAYAGANNANFWLPIPELNRTDADVSLIMMAANDMVYVEPVNDPFFTAHIPITGVIQSKNGTFYLSSAYVHSLACAEQFQYCNPNLLDQNGKPNCTPLSSSAIVERYASTIGLNERALASARVIDSISVWANAAASVGGNGAAALRASDSVFRLTQGPLPDNQWTIEINYWFAASLARIQHGIVQFATGPLYVDDEQSVVKPSDHDPLRWVCNSIKVGDGANQQNFQVLGVSLILILGILVILTSWALEAKILPVLATYPGIRAWVDGGGQEMGVHEIELDQRESGRTTVEDEEPFLSGTANTRGEDDANSPLPAEYTNETADLNLPDAQTGTSPLNRPEQ